VPLHLRNAPTRLMKKEGYGKEYHYPHDNPNHFIEEHYFPVRMQETVLYIFSDSGFEKNIGDRLRHLWKQRYTEEKK
jgi:putative ATPase